jgi:hypothetical protein
VAGVKRVLFTCPTKASAEHLAELCAAEGWFIPSDGVTHYHPDNLRFRYPTEFWMVEAIVTAKTAGLSDEEIVAINLRADELALQVGVEHRGDS